MEELIEAGFIVGCSTRPPPSSATSSSAACSARCPSASSRGGAGVPQVVSLGALDMVNFGPRESVPAQYREPQSVRAQPDGDADAHDARGVRELGEGSRASSRRRPARGAVRPARRHLDDRHPGRPLPRRGGRRGALRGRPRESTPNVELIELEPDINDPAFAVAMATKLHGYRRRRRVKRAEALAKLHATIASGRPIIGAGAGTGLSAKCAEAGGVDLIIIYNSGRFRMARPRLALGHDALRRRQRDRRGHGPRGASRRAATPVLAGVCGTDPFRLMDVFLDELIRIGFSGVQNFPTVGLLDGMFRHQSRGDRDGLRPRGRHDPHRAREGPADGALRVRRRERRRRWPRPAPTCSCRTWA